MPPWFQNLAIRAKVALRFAVICITTIALGVFASQRMGAMSDEIVNLAGNWLPTVRVLGGVACRPSDIAPTWSCSQLLTTNSDVRRPRG
jgi:hypothetical protein